METYVKEEIKLLSCPFCGNNDVDIVYNAGDYGYTYSKAYVKCKCGVHGPEIIDNKYSLQKDKHKELAVLEWNKRK